MHAISLAIFQPGLTTDHNIFFGTAIVTLAAPFCQVNVLRIVSHTYNDKGSFSNIARRAAGGYVQNPSGSASFTTFSGCDTPESMQYHGDGLHRCYEPAVLRLITRAWGRRCLRAMLCAHRHSRSVLTVIQRSVLYYRGQSHGPVTHPGKPAVVWPNTRSTYEPTW